MLIVHLFVSYAHVNLCHFFSSSWCRGLAAASACGSSWTFLFTMFVSGLVSSAGCGILFLAIAFSSTLDHGVTHSKPAAYEFPSEPKRLFIADSGS